MTTETTAQLIARIQAMPHTHKVVTTYLHGEVREFTTRSLASAENHAVMDRRNIGRDLIVRGTETWSADGKKLLKAGETVRIVSVEVKAI